MRIRYITLMLVLMMFSGSHVVAMVHDNRALDADPAKANQPIAPKLEGLGHYRFAVTTKSAESQLFFNQGLNLTYAFNHSEALRAFIDALAKRYSKSASDDRTALDRAYADAMQALVKQYPDDLDAATLYAAALMNLSPWDYWNLDGSPKAYTREILATLQSVVDREPQHAGALHYYIHTVEARHPKRGEKHADMLGGLMPGAGHLVHMPSHIYMRVGRFADSYEANRRAVAADESYITQCKSQGIYPLNYYPHNIHFMAWSAMVLGRPAEALDAARKTVDKVPGDLSQDKNIWALYETFLSQPTFVMVRFGMWEEMLSEPKPDVDSRFMVGIWHYGRALAFLNTGRPKQAKQELQALTDARKAMGQLEHYIGFGTAGTLLTIAEEVVRSACPRRCHSRARTATQIR